MVKDTSPPLRRSRQNRTSWWMGFSLSCSLMMFPSEKIEGSPGLSALNFSFFSKENCERYEKPSLRGQRDPVTPPSVASNMQGCAAAAIGW
jgi:hypothetical protein